jgi:hypothetical protein
VHQRGRIGAARDSEQNMPPTAQHLTDAGQIIAVGRSGLA